MGMMTNQQSIERAVKTLQQLPPDKIQSVCDFAEFLLAELDNKIFVENAMRMAETNPALAFLKDDSDVYTDAHLKVKFHHEER